MCFWMKIKEKDLVSKLDSNQFNIGEVFKIKMKLSHMSSEIKI